MKYYPCLIVSKQELADAGCPAISFKNGRLADMSLSTFIEDYCKMPVVNIRESTFNPDEIFVFVADGYTQVNPMSGKRSVVLVGNYDTLKVVLSDIFAEHPDQDPYDLFCSYAYQADINVQLDLQRWVRNEYNK